MGNRDNTAFALISYAIATEIDAIAMYSYMIKTLNPEYRATLKHILDEEREHAKELSALLKGKREA